MNASPSAVSLVPEPAGVSRRAVVGATATGLALAMLARAYSQSSAQDATPETGGLPPGLAVIPMIDIPVRAEDVPAGGFTLSIYRFTLEPGGVVPNSSLAYPDAFYVESGTIICPGEAPRYLISADGSVRDVGDEDAVVKTGEGFYIPPNVLDGARNEGTELVSLIAVDLIPATEMATPTT